MEPSGSTHRQVGRAAQWLKGRAPRAPLSAVSSLAGGFSFFLETVTFPPSYTLNLNTNCPQARFLCFICWGKRFYIFESERVRFSPACCVILGQ